MSTTVSDATLWAACAKSEVAVFARDGLLSVLAHDLRGSLNTIHSWAHVLDAKFGATHSGMKNALSGIHSGVDQQIQIIENLIEAVCAETKAIPLTREQVLLQPCLESVLAHHRANFAVERGVIFDIDLQLANVQCSADAKRIWQALWATLAYAIEASTRDARIFLTALVERNTCVVLVNFKFSAEMWLDETATHIFEHFVRAAAAQAGTSGTKLALSLPAHVMAAHRGQFERQRKEDGTVTLALRLPLKSA